MSSEVADKIDCYSEEITAGGRLVVKDELTETGNFHVQVVDTTTDGGLLIGSEGSGLVVELDEHGCMELARGLHNLAIEKSEDTEY